MLSRKPPLLAAALAVLFLTVSRLHSAAEATATSVAPAAAKAPKPALVSGVLDWSKLAVVPTKTGERREVFDGPTPTFANCHCHITTLKPGIEAHAAHRHPDEEIIVVKEGVLEVTINGVAQRAGAGSVFFFASNDLHGLRNVGDSVATYHVFRFITAATPAPTPAK